MTVVAADRLNWGPLRSVTLELGLGLHSLVGSPAETAAMVALLAGALRPRRGTVRIAGRDPLRDPEARRRIGCLLESELPLPGRSVRAALGLMLGNRRAVEPTLSSLGLSAWVNRRTDGLSLAEQRSIALTVALATPDPVLVVLWEPFTRTSGIARAALLDRLAEIRGQSCVICATSSVRDALSVDGTACVLNGGEVVGKTLALAAEVAPGSVSDYVVRTERARELVSKLAGRPEIVGVDWDGRTAPRTLHVRGRDGEETARAIVETASGEGIPIESLVAEDPSLKLVQAASLGAMRQAQDQARRIAMQPATSTTQLPVPTPPAAGILATMSSNLPGAGPTGVPLGGVSGTSAPLEGSTAATRPLNGIGLEPASPSAASTPPAVGQGPDTPGGEEPR